MKNLFNKENIWEGENITLCLIKPSECWMLLSCIFGCIIHVESPCHVRHKSNEKPRYCNDTKFLYHFRVRLIENANATILSCLYASRIISRTFPYCTCAALSIFFYPFYFLPHSHRYFFLVVSLLVVRVLYAWHRFTNYGYSHAFSFALSCNIIFLAWR